MTLLPSFSLFAGFVGSVFTSHRVRFVIVEPRAEDLETIGQWLEEGKIRIPIADTFSLDTLVQGLERQQHGGVVGKLAVTVAGGSR